MVPKGWTLGTLKDLADTIMGYAFRSEDFVPTGIPLLRMGNLYQNTLDLNRNPVYLPDSFKVDYKRFLVSPGDLVMSMTGTMGKRDYGFTVEIPSNTQCSLLNQRVLKIVPKNNASSGYILNLLRSELILSVLYSFPGGTKQANLSAKQLQELPVLIPPELEQKKIAQILSTWDKAISVTEKLLTNSQQQKKALMQQLLTGKKRLLDENGVRFSGEWGKFTLSHFGKCIRGVSYKPENICENESDNTIRLLRSTNIQNGELNDKDLIILPKKLVKPMQVLMDGDLAICMANGSKSLVGKSAPYKPNDADYTVGAFCALFRPLKSVSSSFVKFLFESNQYQSQLLVILAGSSINNLKGSDIESINIDAPLHYKEQQKIASVLSAADTEISTLEKKLACLKDEKKALMQQLLTGKR
ncbi:TPA: restriction endonuclease subunit S, partial [Escherichia coli]|nr:restriction endonuclease subunit S [Escherichia coli]HBE5933984.1 restriction endonuclease subunit S [Escherichia coli]